MSTGRCIFFDEARGYGFIAPDAGGEDVFVHRRYLTNADVLKKNQAVSYEVVDDSRRGKPRADQVRVTDGFNAIAYDNHFVLTID